jgi:hypothetical protein
VVSVHKPVSRRVVDIVLACGATISLTLLLQLAMSYATYALLPSEDACVTLTSPEPRLLGEFTVTFCPGPQIRYL